MAEKLTLAQELEQKALYIEELIKSISSHISDFIDKPYLVDEHLHNIYSKLEKAKLEWVNIEKYLKDVYDFRVTVLKLILDTMLKENINALYSTREIEDIEKMYNALVDEWLNDENIKNNIFKIKERNAILKIKKMIEEFSSWTMEYDFTRIMNRLEKAKELWYDVSDLEGQILDL